jgi:uncharacterized protein YprB with RNaseH-like and TPR domain
LPEIESALDPCLTLEYRHPADRPHGRRPIEAAIPRAGLPLSLFDARSAGVPDWHRRVVYFDIETTGLSGGAGTLAFLAGCGWFDERGDFVVRQFFLTSPAGEPAMLDALAKIFDEASLVVTFNGRTFDLPFMEMRWAFHRRVGPTGDLPHFDMLPPARRLWAVPTALSGEIARPGLLSDAEGCSLSALERRVLGFYRLSDVPGFEIPARYFHFLRTGERPVIDGVLEHNRHDLVSLAALMAHALWLADEGPLACREPAEQVALGRLYERAGQADAAMEAWELAAGAGDPAVARLACGHLALLHRRAARHDAAAAAWQRLLNLVPQSRRRLTPIERQAVEGLAIYHEHRARNLEEARRYAEALGAVSDGRRKADTDRRLDRLARKIARGTGEPALPRLAYDDGRGDGADP